MSGRDGISDGLAATHASRRALVVEGAAVAAPDHDQLPALSSSGRVRGGPAGRDVHEQEDPPEADEPATDGRQGNPDGAYQDDAEQGVENPPHRGWAETGVDDSGHERDERDNDEHDPDCEQRCADEKDDRATPSEGRGTSRSRRVCRSVSARVCHGNTRSRRVLDVASVPTICLWIKLSDPFPRAVLRGSRSLVGPGSHQRRSAAATTVSANKTPFVVFRRFASSSTRSAFPSTIRTSRHVSSSR